MKRIKSGKMGRNYGKRDVVFCLIYCTDATPYIDYDKYLNSENEEDKKMLTKKTNLVLAQMRADGRLGFPGGGVEEHHDTLLDALKDELYEEINLENLKEENLELLATFSDEKRHITTYKYKVSFKEFKDIYYNSHKAKHFFSENMGSVMLQITDDTIKNVFKHYFSGTGKLELKLLINEENLI